MKKPAGVKAITNKTIASEILPSRMSMATITPGDQMNRLGNFYKKEANPGAKTGPDALIMFTAMGRKIGFA